MAVSGGEPVVGDVVLAGAGGIRAQAEVFNRIFVVFLGLGTLVGVVVITYTLYNAYKYRYREDEDPDPETDRPELGELPEGGGKGKKLFLSFGISAIIVLSLIAWTYGALVMIENKPAQAAESGADVLTVEVEGFQFGWQYTYPNGSTSSTLYMPTDRIVRLEVSSRDVMHNFGIPELRVKTDAMPGQTTDTWATADEPGEYTANCYELCGTGHSTMTSDVVVMESEDYQNWYADTNGTSTNDATETTAESGSNALAGVPA